MPSVKVLEQKKQIVVDLAEKLKNACAGVIVDYKGITVENDTKLRKELREASIDYFVIKNTLLTRAADQAEMEDLKTVLTGTTAVALSDTDYVAAARILCNYAKGHENYSVKIGFVDGSILSAAEVETPNCRREKSSSQRRWAA